VTGAQMSKTSASGVADLARPERSSWSLFARAFARNSLSLIGTAIILLMILMAVFAPRLAPHDPDLPHLPDRLTGPSATYLLGTDQFGRDILSRIMHGARVSLVVGAGGTALAFILGVSLGSIAGYMGGMVDETLMRVMDLIMAFPYIVLAITLVVLIGPGMVNLILVIGVLRVPQFARMARSRVLSVKEQDFVIAGRAMGQREGWLLLRHILPNTLGPVLVLASLAVATAISAESALSFLGVGIQPPQSSWGTLLSDGRNYILHAPWMTTFPGLFLSLTILGYNLVGDGLRDALDPRTRKGPV
jgi:ABC-type dipeptide/oligopeptide/nickel transport system permease subunit